MRKTIISLAAVGMLGLGALGCAGGNEQSQAAESETCVSEKSGAEVPCTSPLAVSDEEAADAEAKAIVDEARAEDLAAKCEGDLGEFLETLGQLDSRLSVGLTYQDYGTRLGDIRAAYDSISFGQLDPRCVFEVGVGAEAAMNEYVKAGSAWSKCFEDLDCSMDSVQPELRDHWAIAEDKLADVERSLKDLAH